MEKPPCLVSGIQRVGTLGPDDGTQVLLASCTSPPSEPERARHQGRAAVLLRLQRGRREKHWPASRQESKSQLHKRALQLQCREHTNSERSKDKLRKIFVTDMTDIK